MRARPAAVLVGTLLALATGSPRRVRAEDGHELWLRYRRVSDPARLREYRAAIAQLVVAGDSPTMRATRDELRLALPALLGAAVAEAASPTREGALLVGTPATSPAIAALGLDAALGRVGREGYVIRATRVAGRRTIVVAANEDIGALYGSFALLRLLQANASLAGLSIASAPKVELRMLDHWDNLDRSVERGYAGRSLWAWDSLPGHLSPRYRDYARANASIGVNAVALTNVNADARVLTPEYIAKVAVLADVFRPYGIRVWLTARFSAPIELGGLPTADPLDGAVARWWTAKADEIHRAIPDFGGFLVKANSEGQPGPQQYGRTHADGANMLAAAVAPHGGLVVWRAFVYAGGANEDRVKQAYDEFHPLDGAFRENVLLQVKNGPLDFQPREPFHPLFGAMPRTSLVLELQITKEYLGEDTHLVWLGRLFAEVLRADTHAAGDGSTVARVIEGALSARPHTGIAGVANVGTDPDWTGSQFNQGNWYAFGRLAWDPALSADSIAREWTRLTFGNDPRVVARVTHMLAVSREAAVDYMTPLGLAHQMGTGHHYGPAPWADAERPEWTPRYYARADSAGVGVDRTVTGSNALAQYAPAVRDRWASLATVPDSFLLWFHHVPWSYRLRSGRTLWDELVARHDTGVDSVRAMRRDWAALRGRVDAERFADVATDLAIQEREARWWRDASIAWFASFSRLPLPTGHAPPAHPLAWYQHLDCPADPRKPRCPAIQE